MRRIHLAGFLEELAEQAADLSEVASDQGMARLRDKAQELVNTQREIAEAEKRLKELNARNLELAHKELPELMAELGSDKYGVAGANVDIILSDYAKANISADWEEEKREAAFAYLEELGVQDIIRTQVTFSFGRDQFAHAQTVVAMLHLIAEKVDEFGGTEIPVPTIKKSVPWNTLTATVKELHGKGVAIDLEKIGATIGMVVKVKERK